MARQFYTLDVFTRAPLTGNPLAVVTEAEGLDGGRMQAISREFNLSETVFVLPPDNPAHTAKLRIFTPAGELPFAGHPTVGTAVLLAQLQGLESARLILEEGLGPVPVTLDGITSSGGHAVFTAPALPRAAGTPPDVSVLARVLGLEKRDIGFDGFAPALVAAGPVFACVPVAGLEAMGRARINPALWQKELAGRPGEDLYLFCPQAVDDACDFHTRMFAPAMGVAEDPATGSAATALAAVLHEAVQPEEGTHAWRLEQGLEMGRPGFLDLELDVAGGRMRAVRVGGHAVRISEGKLL